MHVVSFGTYDTRAHPRVAVLIAGLRAEGISVRECNAPLRLDTAGRVAILRQPWRLPLLALRVLSCWARLVAARSRRAGRPDAVLVGYLGHFDVHLARLLFPGVPLVLDHLVGAADTARDRGVRGLRARLLEAVDSAALTAATVVLVDTEEQRDVLAGRHRAKALVIPVGAGPEWCRQRPTGGRPRSAGDGPGPLRVVFFGLFTPLQGTTVIARALAGLPPGTAVEVTMIGRGQDLDAARGLAGTDRRIGWRDWVDPADLPALVAAHDVCLGIFGTGPKALRVVPTKVYQGAAAGCAVLTSDTPPQRRALGTAAMFVPPGDADALCSRLVDLAADPAAVSRLRAAAAELAASSFTPGQVVRPLVRRLQGAGS